MAKVKKNKQGASAVVEVDFTNVEDGGGSRPRLAEGDYHARVKKVEKKESQAGNTMLVYDFEIIDGPKPKKCKGKMIRDRVTLTPKALWRFRNLLTAMGKDVPKKVVSVNYAKHVGVELGITLEDEEYEGKIYSKVSDYLDVDTVSGGDVEETDDEDEDLEELDTDEL